MISRFFIDRPIFATVISVVITLVETPKTDKSKGGVLFSEMPPR